MSLPSLPTAEPCTPNYNIAPSTFQPVIRQERDSTDRELVLLRWGLVPFFVNDLGSFKSFSTINARAETVATAPTFRATFKSRRCLIPCYEWKTSASAFGGKRPSPTKQPFAFSLTGCDLMAFAGLWDAWKDPSVHGIDTWLQT